MSGINDIIEWNEFGSEFRLYVKHYRDDNDKVSMNIIFEDLTHDKVTELHIPNRKLKAFLNAVNGDMLSRKYEINV